MKYYIGLDAHSSTSTFAVVDENGQCILRETVKTSEQSLSNFEIEKSLKIEQV